MPLVTARRSRCFRTFCVAGSSINSFAVASPSRRFPLWTARMRTSCGNGIHTDSKPPDQRRRSLPELTTSFPIGWRATTGFSPNNRPASLAVVPVLLAVLLCTTARVGAQGVESATDADNTARLQFIEHALDAGQTAADRWWY